MPERTLSWPPRVLPCACQALYLESGFLPGFVAAVGHLLGSFPDDHPGNHIEQDPYLVSVRNVTDIHLSIPEGLPLLLPQGVRSSTILNGNVLGLYISLKTTHMSLVLDFPRDDDAGRERERIRRQASLPRVPGNWRSR